MSILKKLGIGVGVVLVIGVVGVAVTIAAVSEDRPKGVAGPEAEALADALAKAVDLEAWKKTGAVEWNFAGRRLHLWDRERSYSKFTNGELEVWIDLTSQRGVAIEGGKKLTGEAEAKALQAAWAAWVNDAFWLNPLAKMHDSGVVRSKVELEDGKTGLLVSYASGGLTPGDAYLWIPGDDGKPAQWKMWTSNIPVGGAPASWEGWQKLPTGAWVSTQHNMKAFTLELSGVRAAAKLPELYPEDPFAPLVALLAGG